MKNDERNSSPVYHQEFIQGLATDFMYTCTAPGDVFVQNNSKMR